MRRRPEPETEHAAEPKPERQHLTIAPPPRVALLSPVVEAKPAFGCVAFVSTPSGYRLADLDGPAPDVGVVVHLPDVGEAVVLRLGPSPLPGDLRTCAFLEQPHRADVRDAVLF